MLMNRRTLGGALLFALAALAPSLALASSLGLGNAEPGAGPPSEFMMRYLPWLEPVVLFINAEQQQFYRALTEALKAMRQDNWQVLWLVGVSFIYGVFHAAGPGHGKAVISSYMIANETELKRGVMISFLSAFVQGAVAILVTGAGFLVLRGTFITMTDVAKWLEVASFAIIMGFGVMLLYRKLKSLTAAMTEPGLAVIPAFSTPHNVSFREGFVHDHSHGPGLKGHAHTAGDVCSVCGHAHAPSVDTVRGDRFSIADAWTAIMAVGLRPCSGALIVLTFSFLNGLYLGGALSVLAMSIGTAITVSILATLAVTAKDAALRYAGSGVGGKLGHGIELMGAVIIILFGFTFLMASLQG
ncbi:nickel/cobalt transporter [Rhizobium sp. TRM95796]|uniref:nickel/cobalt transporter n=1 Tax=Rhizobium sp. TRM95796 TaxID=2979862 RepID=UPI0021E7C255|nr:nickel/cobalt transporter [Rhizobium sp. TRM95796]MCV3765752.1 nickel/cobalt transporter [Rhizobium sp. TRM95796]